MWFRGWVQALGWGNRVVNRLTAEERWILFARPASKALVASLVLRIGDLEAKGEIVQGPGLANACPRGNG